MPLVIQITGTSLSIRGLCCALAAAGLLLFAPCLVRADGDDSPADSGLSAGIAPTINDLHSLLLFPVTNMAGALAANSAPQLAAGIKSASLMNTHVRMITYAPQLPAVQRALNVDETVSLSELTPPFNNPSRAKRIAELVGTDGFILETLNTEHVDNANRSVEISCTLQVFSTSFPDAIKTVTVTGASIGETASEEMLAIERRAYDNAARHAYDALYPGIRAAHEGKRKH